MEGSGGESESNPDHVLDLGARHVEVGRDLGEAITVLKRSTRSSTLAPPWTITGWPQASAGSTVTSAWA